MASQTPDKKYCQIIAESIGDIIRFSLNNEFREAAFGIFETKSTRGVEKSIYKSLRTSVVGGCIATCRENEVFAKEISESSTVDPVNAFADSSQCSSQIIYDDSPSTMPNSNTSVDSPLMILTPETMQKNWLQISTQKYKESLKRPSQMSNEMQQKSLRFEDITAGRSVLQ